MKELDQTAEERLREKALANTRALLDKLEKENARPILVPALVVFGIFAIVAVVVFFVFKPQPVAAPLRPTAEMAPAEYGAYVAERVARLANGARNRGRLEGLAGDVDVEVRMTRAGIAQPRIERSTHDTSADGRFTALVKFAEPFGAPPASAEGAFVTRLRMRVTTQGGIETLVVEPR